MQALNGLHSFADEPPWSQAPASADKPRKPQVSELLAVSVRRQHRELGLSGAQGELLAPEGDPRRELRVLESVLFLDELLGDDSFLARLAEPDQTPDEV